MDATADEAQAWLDVTCDILFDGVSNWDRNLDCPAVVSPDDYRRQTYTLSASCDKHGIDPAPLTDCLRFVERAAASYRVENDTAAREAFEQFGQSLDRVAPVLNRLILATAGTGAVAKQVGRPIGTKSRTTLDIEAALCAGEGSDEVAVRFQRTPNYVNKIRRELERNGRLTAAEKGRETRR